MTENPPRRRLRADARRNVDALLEASKAVFDGSGVDAPAKVIADRAGVGVGTLYRHFPQRSDLVVAVIQREVDACAAAGPTLAGEHDPGTALTLWLERFTAFVATKRGFAGALHSGDPAFDELPGYLLQRLGPALESLLEAARASGDVLADIGATDLLHGIAQLCIPVPGAEAGHTERMVALVVAGLRHGTDVIAEPDKDVSRR